MKVQSARRGWLIRSAWVVYRDVSVRVRLLLNAFREDRPLESPVEETLSACAEPSALPKVLLGSKVG